MLIECGVGCYVAEAERLSGLIKLEAGNALSVSAAQPCLHDSDEHERARVTFSQKRAGNPVVALRPRHSRTLSSLNPNRARRASHWQHNPIMNWAAFALAVLTLLLITWCILLAKSRRSFLSIYVSLGLLLLAGMNSAAPIRGFVDPNYVGYGFGLLRADKGLPVTLMAGSVFLVSLVSAFLAVRNRPGSKMWIVAVTCAVFAVIQGWPWLSGVLSNPQANAIQFGEYLTIPGLIGSVLIGALLVFPFVLGVPWAARRAQNAPA